MRGGGRTGALPGRAHAADLEGCYRRLQQPLMGTHMMSLWSFALIEKRTMHLLAQSFVGHPYYRA